MTKPFVKQANIAQGPQQVYNRIESGTDPRAHAGISADGSNELFGVSMANGWSRERQAALIQNWKPWECSMGPRTAGGKGK